MEIPKPVRVHKVTDAGDGTPNGIQMPAQVTSGLYKSKEIMADPQKVKVFDGTNWVDIQPDASAMTLCQVSDVGARTHTFEVPVGYLNTNMSRRRRQPVRDSRSFRHQGGGDKCESGRRHVSVSSQSLGDYLWRSFYKTGSSLIGEPYDPPKLDPFLLRLGLVALGLALLVKSLQNFVNYW